MIFLLIEFYSLSPENSLYHQRFQFDDHNLLISMLRFLLINPQLLETRNHQIFKEVGRIHLLVLRVLQVFSYWQVWLIVSGCCYIFKKELKSCMTLIISAWTSLADFSTFEQLQAGCHCSYWSFKLVFFNWPAFNHPLFHFTFPNDRQNHRLILCHLP